MVCSVWRERKCRCSPKPKEKNQSAVCREVVKDSGGRDLKRHVCRKRQGRKERVGKKRRDGSEVCVQEQAVRCAGGKMQNPGRKCSEARQNQKCACREKCKNVKEPKT